MVMWARCKSCWWRSPPGGTSAGHYRLVRHSAATICPSGSRDVQCVVAAGDYEVTANRDKTAVARQTVLASAASADPVTLAGHERPELTLMPPEVADPSDKQWWVHASRALGLRSSLALRMARV
jgi:hypothetical protein